VIPIPQKFGYVGSIDNPVSESAGKVTAIFSRAPRFQATSLTGPPLNPVNILFSVFRLIFALVRPDLHLQPGSKSIASDSRLRLF